MKIELILIGKTADRSIIALTDDYIGRLSHYCSFKVNVIPALKNTKNLTEEQQKQSEGSLILQQIGQGDTVVLLDEHGTERTSMEMASWLEKKQMSSKKLVFVAGGPYGFSKEVYGRADEMISLSKMTFSHQMVRLIFVEQLYRAFTIIRGESYHHE